MKPMYTKEQNDWLLAHLYWRSNELTELFNLRFRTHLTVRQIRQKMTSIRRRVKKNGDK